MGKFKVALTFLLLVSTFWSIQVDAECAGGKCGLLDKCSTDGDCVAGLYCSDCVASRVRSPICFRNQATKISNISALPFNKVAWLTTHNSFSIVDAPEKTGQRVTFYNQEDSVTEQLKNGVRGLMLDMYDFQEDVWLCHSFGGKCLDITSFAPAIDTLKEIETFLTANPTEIVTIFIEDYVESANGLTNVFKAAGLTKYWFPVASMPKAGQDWPTIGTMVEKNWRLLLFTSKKSKQASEGIAYEWNFVNENQYGDDGMEVGSCPSREESKFMNSTGNTLILQNFFRTNPMEISSCKDNSENLYNQLDACYDASQNRWANFLAVDFYKKSAGGGVFQALDKLNGQMECGCNSPISCTLQTSPGQCPPDQRFGNLSASLATGGDLASAPTRGPRMQNHAQRVEPLTVLLAVSWSWAAAHLLM